MEIEWAVTPEQQRIEHIAKRKAESGIPPRYQGIKRPENARARKFLETYQHGDWTILLNYPNAHLDAAAIANALIEKDEDVIFQNARHFNCSAWHMHRIPYLVIINAKGNEDIIEWRYEHNMTTIITGRSEWKDVEVK